MKLLFVFLLFLWGLGVTAGSGLAESLDRRPNLVFILVDDLGWADVGCQGSRFYQTPNIDRLAAAGIRFTQAYAAGAVCSPTRAALMTGKYPARLHITDWIPGEGAPPGSRFQLPDWRPYLPTTETTVATALARLGYATAHLGKWHLGGGKYLPEQQGFATNIAGGDTGQPGAYFWPYGARRDSHRVPGLAERGGHPGDYLTDQLTDEALSFMEANRDRPFYLNFAHYAVHAPLAGKPALIAAAGEHPGSAGQSNQVYAAMVASVDESVGRVVQKLADLGLTERTLIVFTSDNGGAVHFGQPPATSNLPLRLGKGHAYEGGLRVPLIVKFPGLTPAGRVCDSPVISMDFFPTLVALAGGDQAASRSAVDGVSLVPLLRGQSQLPNAELFWHYPHYWNGGKVTPFSVARIGNWKLIRFYETGREELYDLAADLGERHDCAGSHPGERLRLATRLDEWLKAVGAQMPVARSDDEPNQEARH